MGSKAPALDAELILNVLSYQIRGDRSLFLIKRKAETGYELERPNVFRTLKGNTSSCMHAQ